MVVSGTFIHTPEGKPKVHDWAPAPDPFQPGGNYRHMTACGKESQCVFFTESTGKFDIKMVEDGEAPEKK